MNCLNCNKPIDSKRNTKKYCSNTCKQYAYLKRNGTNFEENQDFSNEIIASGEKSTEIETTHESIAEKLPIKPVVESGYKKIRPKILSILEDASFRVEYDGMYFSTDDLGSIRPENFEAFGNVCKRIYCILENVLTLNYKRKVFYNTILILRKGLAETLTSAFYKQLPKDFPFTESLMNLFEQLGEFESYLFKNQEGLKFSLEKSRMVHYINILRILRRFVLEKPTFRELFPHYFKG